MFLRRCAPVRVKKIRNLGFSDLTREEDALLHDTHKKWLIVAISILLHFLQKKWLNKSYIAIKVMRKIFNIFNIHPERCLSFVCDICNP